MDRARRHRACHPSRSIGLRYLTLHADGRPRTCLRILRHGLAGGSVLNASLATLDGGHRLSGSPIHLYLWFESNASIFSKEADEVLEGEFLPNFHDFDFLGVRLCG